MEELYHISLRPIPNILHPRLPYGTPINPTKDEIASPFYEHLPCRVSFSPSVVECFLATYSNYRRFFEYEVYRTERLVFKVYKAKNPDKATRISDEVMRDKLHDYHLTNEVAFTTPIEVDFVGEVEILNPFLNSNSVFVVKYAIFNSGEEKYSIAPVAKINVVNELSPFKVGDFSNLNCIEENRYDSKSR